jgi:hypothetical protein
MSVRQFRFTIGQLVRLVIYSAVMFAVLRTRMAAVAVLLCFLLPGFVMGPGIGVKRGPLAGWIIAGAGIAIAVIVELWQFLDSIDKLGDRPAIVSYSELIAPALIGVIVSICLLAVAQSVRPAAPDQAPDDSRGPIVRPGLDDEGAGST